MPCTSSYVQGGIGAKIKGGGVEKQNLTHCKKLEVFGNNLQPGIMLCCLAITIAYHAE